MAESGVHPVSGLLEESLLTLSREAPTHFAALRAALARLAVRLVIGRSTACTVVVDGPAPWVTALRERGNAAWLDVRVSHRALNALVGGRLTLAQAAELGDLYVRGSADDVIRLTRAVEAWIHGALRSPSFPRLGQRFWSIRIEDVDEPIDAAPSRKDERPWADPATSDSISS